MRRLLPDLFHVALAREWEAGGYARSTRGLDLAQVGFVHLALAWQVEGVLARFYADCTEPLLLLRVDPALVGAAVLMEPAAGSTEAFPHLYGPLQASAVLEEVALARDTSGWLLPDWLSPT